MRAVALAALLLTTPAAAQVSLERLTVPCMPEAVAERAFRQNGHELVMEGVDRRHRWTLQVWRGEAGDIVGVLRENGKFCSFGAVDLLREIEAGEPA